MPEVQVLGNSVGASYKCLIPNGASNLVRETAGDTRGESIGETRQTRQAPPKVSSSEGLLRWGQALAIVVASVLASAGLVATSKPENANGGPPAATATTEPPFARPLSHSQRQESGESLSYTPIQIARYYNFPRGTDGHGQTIGIVSLGGGYREEDLKTYFAGLGIPMPKVTWVSVNGAKNDPHGVDMLGRHYGADVETTMDIQIAGAVAPGADIVVYFAPNNKDGMGDAVRAATWDRVNHPSIISISWGAPEELKSPYVLRSRNEAFREAAFRGITIFVASGDDGSEGGIFDGKDHIDFPASSPWVTACGGTSLFRDTRGIFREVTWSGSGGGVSEIFPLPAWQRRARVPLTEDGWAGRGAPDVAGVADNNTGYIVRVNDTKLVVGGTSAVAPLWAGLTARINEGLGGYQVGYINPMIYNKSFSDGFRDIVEGDNGTFKAIVGWDAATGLGSPNGENLLGAFRQEIVSWRFDSRGSLIPLRNPYRWTSTISISPWGSNLLDPFSPSTVGDRLPLRRSG